MKKFIEITCEKDFKVSVSVDHIESVAAMVAEEGKEEEMERAYPGCNTIINTVRGHIIAKETYGEVLVLIQQPPVN